MSVFKKIEKMMFMTDEGWDRHSNPLSVYTRIPCLSLLSLSIWSREYIGLYSIVPILLSVFWIWYNPRAFCIPATTDNWASRGTFGERIFLQKDSVDIPKHHVKMAHKLTGLIIPGIPVLFYGLYVNDLWIITFGNFWVLLPKMWYFDRMVWIYEDMKDTSPEFKNWLKS
ncbi:MAG: hypothetical protein QNL62_25955 [Gammaproteobacteria bacterium]|nr:hypothetical protein [Gammaproteobacteria bacterium]